MHSIADMQSQHKTCISAVFICLCCISLTRIVLITMQVDHSREHQVTGLLQKQGGALSSDYTTLVNDTRTLHQLSNTTNTHPERRAPGKNIITRSSNIKLPLPLTTETQTSQHKTRMLVFVMCMSRRSDFERRFAIRRSWKRGVENAAFFVGDRACEIPHEARTTPWSCTPKHTTNQKEMHRYQQELQDEQTRIQQEYDTHKDMVMLGMKDFYRALPKKLKLAYEWSVKNTQAQWFLKIDDDSAVRMGALESFLGRIDATQMYVIGSIRRQAAVPKSGKWAEPDYSAKTYPPFANGAEGHVVSRKVAESVYLHDGFEFQGEDVSLGIWISEMKLPVIWKDAAGQFVSNGNCHDRKYIVIGHDISPAKMVSCFETNTQNINKANKNVYHHLVGRLGNQLFQTASIMGIASKNNAQACLDGGDIHKHFVGLPPPCSPAKRADKQQLLSEHAEYAMYHDFEVTENVEITGYLQSHRYFSHEIRSQLRFKQHITESASKITNKFASKTLVGIHMRRYELDYLKFPSNQYFINAKYFFSSKYHSVQFIVTCDDIKWCSRQQFLLQSDVYIVREQNDAVIDMAILSACQHIILSVGTFGWWAAFLGPDAKGGTVVYYDSEFVMEHPVNKGKVVLLDFYPRNWIALSSSTPVTHAIQDSDWASSMKKCTEHMITKQKEITLFHQNKGQQNKIYEHPEKLYPNATIIDAGGFTGRDLGVFRSNAAKLGINLDDMNVEIFEPHPKIFKRLISNIGLNPTWLSAHNYGLGNNNTQMCMDDESDGASTIKKEQCSLSVNVKDIAEVIKAHAQIDLLHINCEGCEIPILNRVLETSIDKVQTIEVQMHKKYVTVQKYCQIATALFSAGYHRVYHYAFVWEAWTRVNTLHTVTATIRPNTQDLPSKFYNKCAWSPLLTGSHHKTNINENMMQTYELMTAFYDQSTKRGIKLGALISGKSRCFYMYGEFCDDPSDLDIDISNGDPVHQPPHALRDIIPKTKPYKLSWDSDNFDHYGKCECELPNRKKFVCVANIQQYLQDMYGVSWWVPIPGLKISVLQRKETRARYINPILESLRVYQNSNHEIDAESVRNILIYNKTKINHSLIEQARNKNIAFYSSRSNTEFSTVAKEMNQLFQYLKKYN